MATKKQTKAKETARLTIVCDSNQESTVKIKGDLQTLTAALASLMSYEDEENVFREMMGLAIQVVLEEDKRKKKKKLATKKKAAVKKKK